MAYSTNTIRALYGLTLFILAWALLLVSYDLAGDLDTVAAWVLPVVLALHFAFFVTVCFLLFRKLFVLMRRKAIDAPAPVDEAGDDAQTTQDMAVKLDNIDSMTRFSLLMSIGLSSTYIFSIINNVVLLAEEDHPARAWGVGYSLIGGDLLVNALVIYLLFPINTALYDLCCGCCHKCCQGCCVQCVYANVKGQTDKDKQQLIELILSDDGDSGAVIQ